ncbi:MAG: hypothetical protein KGJ43_04095 [Acidobacteriota bacterium]|nr:hypothetical protein [Acidobacteriota bacterium]
MVTSQAERTIVKSPPELWSELSDAAALSRHLSELGAIGEIKITRVEPERKVEWEARGASGAVELKPSGWGTRVTLSLSREPLEAAQPHGAAAPGPQALAAKPAADRERPAADGSPAAANGGRPGPRATEPSHTAPSPGGVRASADRPQPTSRPAVLATEPAETPEPGSRTPAESATLEPPDSPAIEPWAADGQASERRVALRTRVRVLVGWIGGRMRRGHAVESEPASPAAGELDAIAEQLLGRSAVPRVRPVQEAAQDGAQDGTRDARSSGEPAPGPDSQPAATEPDSHAGPAEPAPAAAAPAVPETPLEAERGAALLNAVLDRLGEAHHRPFSRS